MRIVIVEDEAFARKTLKNLIALADRCYRVVGEAESAQEAVQIIERTHPDVLITDIQMPDENGLEMIERLQQKNRCMYVIIISGYSEFKYAQDAIRLGVKQYLLKPFSLDDITRALQTAQSAIGAGYAADLLSPEGADPAPAQSALVDQAMRIIDQNLRLPCSLNEVAGKLYVSAEHLSRQFKKSAGKTFSAYVAQVKMQCARNLMRDTDLALADIAESVGYANPRRFAACFKEHMGVSANKYLRQARLNRP